MSSLDVSLSPLITNALAKARANNERQAKDSIASPSLAIVPNAPKIDKLTIHGIPTSEMTAAVKEAITSLMEENKVLRSERVRLQDSLRKAESLADTDPLAGTYNRRAFMRELSRVMSFSQRYDIPSSLIFFDLNGFKSINDNYGHSAGDAIIKGVADALSNNVRESDLVGRVGGDEFAVLLAKATPEEAAQKANGLQNAINTARIMYDGHSLGINATFGLHHIGPNDSAQNAMDSADSAMYSNKLSPKIAFL